MVTGAGFPPSGRGIGLVNCQITAEILKTKAKVITNQNYFLISEQNSHFSNRKRPLLKHPTSSNGHWPFCVTKVEMDVVP